MMINDKNNAQEIAQKISNLLPRIKSGTLRFYGEWFGRPQDNYHQITKAENKGNKLIIYFRGNEILTIISPEGFHISESEFIIKKSQGIIWQWHNYGTDIIDKNLMTYNYFIDDEKSPIIINPEKNVFNFKADENKNVFEIC